METGGADRRRGSGKAMITAWQLGAACQVLCTTKHNARPNPAAENPVACPSYSAGLCCFGTDSWFLEDSDEENMDGSFYSGADAAGGRGPANGPGRWRERYGGESGLQYGPADARAQREKHGSGGRRNARRQILLQPDARADHLRASDRPRHQL